MKSLWALVAGIPVVMQVGCASMNGGAHLTSTSYKLTGSLARSSGCTDFEFIKASNIEIGNDTVKRDLDVNVLIKTKHILKLDIVALPNCSYEAVVGPNFGSTEYAKAHIRNTMPRIYLDCGWLYLTGTGTAGETKWVSAGADGSKVAIQITKFGGVETHRVFYLEGTSGYYKLAGASGPPSLFPTADMYVDITSGGVVTGPLPIGSNADAIAFKAEMVRIQNAISP
mgnify:CR=1 FL=1